MKNQISIINITSEQVAEINMSSTNSGWKLLPKSQLPNIFPQSFAEKTDSFLAITAQTSTGGTYLVWRTQGDGSFVSRRE